ncbi:uncharacterized protein LOC100114326 isoform X1 [Nasonia vitripennis]|uniref:Uncharacterized protein n=2 Tax=Nasonia vitripennis TaxID=7425 RepID=A0A7M7QFA7_NASVI|nr:uncharacterized protein LOC100114326 isoform X1 [Nasonia vitripennis]
MILLRSAPHVNCHEEDASEKLRASSTKQAAEAGDEGRRLVAPQQQQSRGGGGGTRGARESGKMPASRGAVALLRAALLILIIAGSARAYSSRTPECTFPSRWEGMWFQSGVRQSILISKNILSSKGTCLQNEGDKFLLVNEKSCYRCVVIHEKHSNVLQYKETYCHSRNTLAALCSYITGDALLFSMFREEATSVPCPFHAPMTFTYNRGHGRCFSPQSNVETCTDESKLLFKYQACPDVPASESTVEELECLATWKEGSNRYLVGRLHNGHSLSNEDRYRCFVYERRGQNVAGLNRAAAAALGIASVLDHEMSAAGPNVEGSPEVYKVAQSGDATCNGLFSPLEGSRTMTLTKASSPGKCWFPTWLTGKTSMTWHTLDLTRSYTFHMSNASLHTVRSNGSARSSESQDFLNLPGQDEHNVKILCNSVKAAGTEQNIFMIVAHFTVGCQNGYMCMAFYKRDGHVVELQTGSTVSRAEEACSSPHYQQHSIPYVTLVTSSPEPRQCPYLGKFTVTGVNGASHAQQKSPGRNKGYKSDRVRHGQERKLEFDVEKRRGNNQYLVRDQLQQQQQQHRRVRSEGNARLHSRDPEEEAEEQLMEEELWARRSGKPRLREEAQAFFKSKFRKKRQSKLEDFQLDKDDLTHQASPIWTRDSREDDSNLEEMSDADYFGEYIDEAPVEPPKKKRVYPTFLTYSDLVRLKREIEEDEDDVESDDDYEVYDEEDEEEARRRRRRRKKRDAMEEDEQRPRCNSDITTLTVGCSTADRMEFQSECVDDDAVTAYSCHGRWFDAEGTQFVIATPLATRRAQAAWSGPDGSRAQPYRNSRRLCFMYRESGGVVSLTASPVACQRGVPPPPPLLAFNATSIGQCMDGASSLGNHSLHLILSVLVLILAMFR